jgi:hypothetical protein
MKPETVRDVVVWLLGEGPKDHTRSDNSEEEETINPPPFICCDVDPKVFFHSQAVVFLEAP